MTDPKLAFNIPGRGRHYGSPSRKGAVPSVTNIKKQKNQPKINGHNIKVAAEYAVENRDKLAALEPHEAIALIKDAPWQKREASKIGDLVHGWIDGYIKTGDHPRDQEPAEGAPEYANAPRTARRMWRQFEGFNERYNPKWLDSEFTCWSDTYGYAGTADWAMSLSGLNILGDTKTGTSVYPDVGLQLAPLAKADFIMADDGTELPMPKWDRLAALHVRPTFARLIPVEHPDECFEAFLGLLKNLRWDHDVEPNILQYAPKIMTDYKGV